MDPADLVIEDTDGPFTCLWKSMFGKGWMSSDTIIEGLETCHYTSAMLRVKLAKAPPTLIEKRRMTAKAGRGLRLEYRIVAGSQPPEEVTQVNRTKKQRGVRAIEPTVAEKQAANDLFSTWFTKAPSSD